MPPSLKTTRHCTLRRYQALLVTAALLLAVPICAQHQPPPPLTASDIITQLERRLGGTVIAVEPSADGLRYRVRMLTAKGEVRILNIDTRTGKKLAPSLATDTP